MNVEDINCGEEFDCSGMPPLPLRGNGDNENVAAPTGATENVPQVDRNAVADAETKKIMKNHIADTTQSCYEYRQINFILWLYDRRETHQGILSESSLLAMSRKDEVDKQQMTAGGRPSKKRDHLKKEIRSLI